MILRRWLAWCVSGSLIRRFAVLSLLVIAALTAALSFVISSALEKDMLAREWSVTASYIRLEAKRGLSPADFADPYSPAAQANFRAFSEELMAMPEMIRVKLYSRAMAVIWSDEPRLIGQRFADNPELADALNGETVADIETGGKKQEHVFEKFPRVAELYVPLTFADTPGVIGIVETYKVPEGVFANIQAARRIVVGTSVAGGLLLWASLFGIVRGAARRIERQHQTLKQRSSELSDANQEIKSVHAQLVNAERMAAIGEVVAAVAHGIRNPLANVRALTQLALLDCCNCQQPQAATPNLTTAISEVDRLAGRITELLQFVRPAERRREPVDLNAVLADSVQVMKGRIADGQFTVVEDLDPALPPIAGDFVLLEQAFGGLLENALEAMAGAGTLTVTSRREAELAGPVRVVVDIADTGPGIRAEHVSRIFELFYTTKSQGTGLGLALAKKFIEAYGGTLALVSRPGPGTVFRATFPATGA